MKFKPCQRVSLSSDDGQVVVARPYFYTATMGNGLLVDLLTDDGTTLQTIDETAGVYSLGADGPRLRLQRPSTETSDVS